MTCEYVEVAVPPPVARELTYRIPDSLAGAVQPGALVVAPVAGRRFSGIVTAVNTRLPDGLALPQIRCLECVLDSEAVPAELAAVCRWMAEYYFAPLGSALMATLPPELHLASRRQVRLTQPDGTLPPAAERAPDAQLWRILQERGPQPVTALRRCLDRKALDASLRRLRQAGHIEILPILPDSGARARMVAAWRIRPETSLEHAIAERHRRSPRQADCLRLLATAPQPVPQARLTAAGYSPSLLRSLERSGAVERTAAEAFRDPLAHIEPATASPVVPTDAQRLTIQGLVEALAQRQFCPALLEGVTGSGKTLVYMELAAHALQQGRGTIILVPEIALAWQMVRRFRARFGDQVAVLHSQLSPGERYDTWRRLRRGEQRLVIGPRSTVLAPLPDLALIVVDEEHDGAYKQEDLESTHPLTYSARDVALVRAQRLRALVVLGSATPSLESHWNAEIGKYHRYRLPTRVDDRPLPRVQVVDMRQEPRQGRQPPIFSRLLRQKMRDRMERQEQTVLLQNRRGFAPLVVCGACGAAVRCEQCHVSVTYHRQEQTQEVRCHYCNRRMPPPQACPACGSSQLSFQGVGTQRVEQALVQQFRGIRVIRMDVDTTGWKGAHDELVERFRRGEADVLLGTQMVAKGLDFPEVTLVGVISADTGMHLPDFRAAERSFQLLTQVAGRSGRGTTPGEVVIQTLLPDAAVLRTAAAQDFAGFAAAELAERREAGFPPYGRLALLRWLGKDERQVEATARQGADLVRGAGGAPLQVHGPAPAPLARLRGRYRYHALLCGGTSGQLHRAVDWALERLRAVCPSTVELAVNVDPVTMM